MGNISLVASVIDWGWLRIGPPYIYINIDPVIVHVGPLALHWYGLMYVVAILVGFFVAQRYALRKGITPGHHLPYALVVYCCWSYRGAPVLCHTAAGLCVAMILCIPSISSPRGRVAWLSLGPSS